MWRWAFTFWGLHQSLTVYLLRSAALRKEDVFIKTVVRETPSSHHWAKNQLWYQYTQFAIVPTSRKIEVKRGRPRNNEERRTVYTVQAEIARNSEVILVEMEKLGRFILASNDLSLDPETMLEYYKNQAAVERGFRFLKDKSFRVSEVYLKKNERIEALSMVMVLALLIYSVAEWLIRKRLKE